MDPMGLLATCENDDFQKASPFPGGPNFQIPAVRVRAVTVGFEGLLFPVIVSTEERLLSAWLRGQKSIDHIDPNFPERQQTYTYTYIEIYK